MKLTFLGANHEVTGSCTMLEAAGQRFLIDYGMEPEFIGRLPVRVHDLMFDDLDDLRHALDLALLDRMADQVALGGGAVAHGMQQRQRRFTFELCQSIIMLFKTLTK